MSTAFASVKLPSARVQQAREAAQPLRRSVAGQIEYWATLGRVAEHSGLTVQEARTAIEGYETAPPPVQANQADNLLAQFVAAQDDGSLAQRVREVIASNQRKAVA